MRAAPPAKGPGHAFGQGLFGPGHQGNFWRTVWRQPLGRGFWVVAVPFTAWAVLTHPAGFGDAPHVKPPAVTVSPPPTRADIISDDLHDAWIIQEVLDDKVHAGMSAGQVCAAYVQLNIDGSGWTRVAGAVEQRQWDSALAHFTAAYGDCRSPIPGRIATGAVEVAAGRVVLASMHLS